MILTTRERVPASTPARSNEAISSATASRIAYFTAHPEGIGQRLLEMHEEWDVERLIETEAPVMTALGLLLGTTVSRKWLLLPVFVQGMMVLHALRGSYPLLPLFRAMGFRTEAEIAAERYALLALRGEFWGVARAETPALRADRAFRAATEAPALG